MYPSGHRSVPRLCRCVRVSRRYPMSMVMPLQAYELKRAPHPAPFSILTFTGVDRISQLYRYEIEFTSPMAGLPMDQVLGRPAQFIIAPIDPHLAYLRKMFGENA